jgi:F-type H+-transporting ATPase subunit delta
MSDRLDGYASAAFELAKAEGELPRVERELFGLAQALDRSPELRNTLSDPRLPRDRKQAIVDDLVGRRASEVTVAIVEMLLTLGHITDLPELAERLSQRMAASQGKELAEVRTAVPLDDDTLRRLAEALERQVGRPVEVRTIVDPSIIGGVVARVGDVVIDGSVKRRLEAIRQMLTA